MEPWFWVYASGRVGCAELTDGHAEILYDRMKKAASSVVWHRRKKK